MQVAKGLESEHGLNVLMHYAQWATVVSCNSGA